MLAYNLYICSTTFQNYYKLTAALMRSDLIWVLACWREVFVWEITTTVSLDKSSYSQISQCWEVITLAGIWQVARSHFNSSKTSNPVKSGIITPLKNCGQLLKKQPIVVFQLSWLPRSPYNQFVSRSSSANTEKLSSSSNGFLKHKMKLAIAVLKKVSYALCPMPYALCPMHVGYLMLLRKAISLRE